MSRLRFYLFAVVAWCFIFYNTERLLAPINLASFVYVLAAFYAAVVILFPVLYRVPKVVLYLGSMLPYFVLKNLLGYEIGGTHLPLTVTEIVSISITLFLARQIGYELETLRNEILRLTIGFASTSAHPFQSAQAEFYREIRRARHYNRPAALLSVTPTNESVELSINRFIKETQNNIIRQYITARTAELLRAALKETDVVTMRNNHFLVLLPETENQHIPVVMSRLQTAANEKLGLKLQIGASTFPDDALTFESLVHSAEERMKEAIPGNTTGVNQKFVGEMANGSITKSELNKADTLH